MTPKLLLEDLSAIDVLPVVVTDKPCTHFGGNSRGVSIRSVSLFASELVLDPSLQVNRHLDSVSCSRQT